MCRESDLFHHSKTPRFEAQALESGNRKALSRGWGLLRGSFRAAYAPAPWRDGGAAGPWNEKQPLFNWRWRSWRARSMCRWRARWEQPADAADATSRPRDTTAELRTRSSRNRDKPECRAGGSG